jgi:hypothetical protein
MGKLSRFILAERCRYLGELDSYTLLYRELVNRDAFEVIAYYDEQIDFIIERLNFFLV